MPSRRAPDPPPIEIRRFTPDVADWAIKLLSARIKDVQALDPGSVNYDDERVRAIGRRIITNVLEIFGENSREYREHQYHDVSSGSSSSVVGGFFDDTYELRRQQEFASEGIPRSITMLESLIEVVQERTIATPPAATPEAARKVEAESRNEVFIVHGHADGPRESAARLIEKLGLKATILHEQANEGRTLIEKLEGVAGGAGYAVIIASGDDKGGPKAADPATFKLRPRQNVVAELGFFHGKLGRGRVCVLYEEGVEIPSDYHGVAYVPLDGGGAWRILLARELRAAGFEIDMNRAM